MINTSALDKREKEILDSVLTMYDTKKTLSFEEVVEFVKEPSPSGIITIALTGEFFLKDLESLVVAMRLMQR